jgi:hypothetical protein
VLPPLDDRQRRALLRFGIFLAGAAIALSPLVGVPAVPLGGSRENAKVQYEFQPEPRVTIMPLGQRDPFAPQAADLPQGAVTLAVLLGAAPRAIVEIGSVESLVGVGDRIANVRVTAIDDGGVLLSDGSRIHLKGDTP